MAGGTTGLVPDIAEAVRGWADFPKKAARILTGDLRARMGGEMAGICDETNPDFSRKN